MSAGSRFGHPSVRRIVLAISAVLLMAWIVATLIRTHDPVRVAAREQLAAKGIDAKPLSLYLHATWNDTDAIRLLLDAGISPGSAIDEHGVSALMRVVAHQNLEAAELLLERGADPNHVSKAGLTALHSAAAKGHLGLTRRLLAAGADPNIVDIQGGTPLLEAISSDCWRFGGGTARMAIIRELVAAGARVNVRDDSGVTVFDAAKKCYPVLLPLLRDAAKNESKQ